MIEEIQKHFEEEYPREGCGIIGIVKGKKKWFPCTNVAENEEDFILSSDDYFRIVKKCDIFAIVHSHPDASNKPSISDINNCNALGIPYWIFSYPDMESNIVEPERKTHPLIGREYKFGIQDCFEAMRDYLKSKNIEIPPRIPFEDNWWDRELDYFSDEIIKQWGGVKVPIEEIQKKAKELQNNEELKQIINELGRLESTCKQESNTDIAQAFERVFAERLVEFKSKVADIPNETRGIKLSGEIERMLPSEAGLLGNSQLKDLWYAKFAEKQLITYRLEGTTTTTKIQKIEAEIPTFQGSEKGPILALIDTSGSMSGFPTHIAKAIVLRMCQVAFREQRELLLGQFGSVGEIEEYRLEMNANGLMKLCQFLQKNFGGGTDINGPIKKVLPYLRQETWQTADIVIVSDGEFGVYDDTLRQLNEARQKHNVRVTGILIGNNYQSFQQLTDKSRLYKLTNGRHIYQY